MCYNVHTMRHWPELPVTLAEFERWAMAQDWLRLEDKKTLQYYLTPNGIIIKVEKDVRNGELHVVKRVRPRQRMEDD